MQELYTEQQTNIEQQVKQASSSWAGIEKRIELTSGSWDETRLTLSFSLEGTSFIPDRRMRIVAKSVDEVLVESRVSAEKRKQDNCTVLTSVLDFAKLPIPDDGLIALQLFLTLPNCEPVALGKKRKKGVLIAIAQQFPHLPHATIVTDEVGGYLTFLVVGDSADASSLVSGVRKGRPFANTVLLYALADKARKHAKLAQYLGKHPVEIISLNSETLAIGLNEDCFELPVSADNLKNWLKPTFSMASWNNNCFSFELEYTAQQAKFFDSCRPQVLLILDSEKSFPLPTNIVDTSILCTIDFSQIISSFSKKVLQTASLEVVYTTPLGEVHVGEIGALRQAGTFKDFVDGFYLDNKALVLPDEGSKKIVCFRIIGREAPIVSASQAKMEKPQGALGSLFVKAVRKASGSDPTKPLINYFRLKNRETFENRLLFFAGSINKHTLFACADAIRNKTLTTSLDYTDLNKRVFCLVEAPGLDCPLRLDVTTMSAVKKSTMLEQGMSFESLSRNKNHDEQFSCLFDMLCEFDELCQEHGLDYYLGYGTLIGALRHKGFIPWDHDVDLLMKRDDYRKLQEIFAQGKGPEGRILEDADLNPNCPIGFGRYMNVETSRYNPGQPRGYAKQGQSGIFIDVFILLPVEGQDLASQAVQSGELIAYLEEIAAGRSCVFRSEECWQAKSRLQADIEQLGRSAALKEWRNMLFGGNEDNASFYFVPSAGSTVSFRYPKKWFGTPKRINLLGHDFSIPAESYEALENLYGPDWRFYPADIHVPLERNLYNSLCMPSDKTIQLINADSNCEKLIADKRTLHDAQIEDNRRKRFIFDLLFEMGALNARAHRDKTMQEAGLSLEEAISEKKWGLIERAMVPYFQIRELTCGHRVDLFYPLESEWFSAAIKSQLSVRPADENKTIQLGSWSPRMTSNSRIYRAWNLLFKRENALNYGPLDSTEQKTKELLQAVFSIRSHIEEGRFDSARKNIDWVLAQLPDSVDALMGDLYLRILDAHTKADQKRLSELGEEAHKRSIETKEEGFLFCVALVAEMQGERELSIALFAKMRKTTKDGMIMNYCESALERLIAHD